MHSMTVPRQTRRARKIRMGEDANRASVTLGACWAEITIQSYQQHDCDRPELSYFFVPLLLFVGRMVYDPSSTTDCVAANSIKHLT